MKIAIVSPLYATDSFSDSGIALHYKHLTSGLLELGHDVIVYHFPYEIYQSSTFVSNGVTVHQLGFSIPHFFYIPGVGRILKYLKILDWFPSIIMQRQVSNFLKKRVREDCIDIIESTSNRGMLANYAKYKNRPPICTRVSTTMNSASEKGNYTLPINYKYEAMLEYLHIKRSDSLITHSQNHAVELEREVGISRDKFKLIPHGIPLPNLTNYNNKLKVKNISVLFVGRLEKRKGIDVLLKAIPLVHSRIDSINFSIVGHDPEGLSKSFLQTYDLKDKVCFKGKVSIEKLRSAYKECDIFVAPSYYESFGLIFLEAMSYAKPTIGTKTGGIPDVISDGNTGKLIDPGDYNALAEAIIQLTNSPELRIKWGTEGRNRVEALFSTKAMSVSTTAHFQSLLSDRIP